MAKARVVNPPYEKYFSARFNGISTGIILLLIGIAWLLRDIGYIPSNISMWAIFFIVIGLWWILSRIFE